jgi:hypothetical protein
MITPSQPWDDHISTVHASLPGDDRAITVTPAQLAQVETLTKEVNIHRKRLGYKVRLPPLAERTSCTALLTMGLEFWAPLPQRREDWCFPFKVKLPKMVPI